MGVRNNTLDHNAILRGAMAPPLQIVRNRNNVVGVALQQVVAVGAYIQLGGANTDVYRSGGAAGQDCYLHTPSSFAVITEQNANTFTIEVKGIDYFGRPVTTRFSKTAINRQTCTTCPVVFQYIEYMKLIAHSDATKHLRVGFLHSGFAFAAGDMDTRLANDVDASAVYLPLPIQPLRYQDIVAVICTDIGATFDTPGGDVGGVLPVYTYLDTNAATDGGFALQKRVPPINSAAFSQAAGSFLSVPNGTFKCFPKATVDPVGPTRFHLLMNPGTLVNR